MWWWWWWWCVWSYGVRSVCGVTYDHISSCLGESYHTIRIRKYVREEMKGVSECPRRILFCRIIVVRFFIINSQNNQITVRCSPRYDTPFPTTNQRFMMIFLIILIFIFLITSPLSSFTKVSSFLIVHFTEDHITYFISWILLL